MTGEITLRGRVLPIGGLKEKLLAAHRGGITTVIIPKENRKDLREVPRRVLKALRVVLVEHMDEVLREALRIDRRRRAVRPARGSCSSTATASSFRTTTALAPCVRRCRPHPKSNRACPDALRRGRGAGGADRCESGL